MKVDIKTIRDKTDALVINMILRDINITGITLISVDKFFEAKSEKLMEKIHNKLEHLKYKYIKKINQILTIYNRWIGDVFFVKKPWRITIETPEATIHEGTYIPKHPTTIDITVKEDEHTIIIKTT